MKPFVELDTVQLQKDHLECGLAAGALGTVVLVHAQGEAYEVEFIGLDGHTQAVLTLSAAEVAAIAQPWRQAAWYASDSRVPQPLPLPVAAAVFLEG